MQSTMYVNGMSIVKHFMRWKLAHPWWGSNPRSFDYIPSSITRHVSDHQSKACQIYFYISGSPNKEIVYENDKTFELNMSDDGHFEFCDLWENSVIYSLAYGRNGFSTKFSYRSNKWSIFPKKMPTGLYLELYFNFLSWLWSLGVSNFISHIIMDVINYPCWD